MDIKLFAVLLFAVTYILLLALPSKKPHIAVGSALIFVLTGAVPAGELINVVDWNVILMITGTMGIVSLFIESRMPALIGDLITEKTSSVKWVIILLSAVAGLISAFVDNVATVLIIAPIAVNLFKRLKLPLAPAAIIAISLASNLQGAATLVGDTTSILLAGSTGMDFIDFFVLDGKPGMFWVVQVSALAATVVLFFRLGKPGGRLAAGLDRTVVEDYFPTYLLLGLVSSLIFASFIPSENKPDTVNGLICVVLMAIGLAHEMVTKNGFEDIKRNLLEIDFRTVLLLAALFVVVGGIVNAGVIDDISGLFLRVGGSDLFVTYSLIVWFSVLVSAFVDNIPYVAAMLPVIAVMTETLGLTSPLLYLGLLSGATLGGNLTPVGASANITALGILRAEGREVSVGDFMAISVPFTLTAVVVGYVLIWVIWS